MEYDVYKGLGTKHLKGKIIIGAILALLVVAIAIATNIYMEIVQLNEIGNLSSVYITNLKYKILFSVFSFIIIFALITLTNIFIKRNLKSYLKDNNLPAKSFPNLIISTLIALAGSYMSKDFFYQKALSFFNYSSFDKLDPIFGNNIGYYVFQRPFLMSFYQFISALWMFIIVYTLAYYALTIFTIYNNVTMQDLKAKTILRHNLINLAIFFLIKFFSYKFQREGILYSSVVNATGASYVDVNIWLNYFKIAPFLLIAIVVVSFIFILKNKLKTAALTIAIFPAVWIVVTVASVVMQGLIVKPNEISLESKYLANNMRNTRDAYDLSAIKKYDFPEIKDLTPDVINRNMDTVNNIRIVDYQATLDSDIQLQSNTNFYTFNNGDIINYDVNGKEIPIFITPREINKNNLPQKSYINNTFKYTHGYGIVINPINKLTPEGQNDFILSGLNMRSTDSKLKIDQPRIYYGELTDDYVIVNKEGAGKLKEIDYDGNTETSYAGNGGIKMGMMNRLLFSLKYMDLTMIISNNVSSNSNLLINRQIIKRAQRAVPFLTVDNDPYIIPTSDGRLKWVIDAYTTTGNYPYAQYSGNINYIRNSVKIIVDAYDGTVDYYVIDKEDPIIKTYMKIYPGIFKEDELPADIKQHMRYPEELFKIQTNVLKKYHLDPDANQENISMFYTNQDLWEIAKYPKQTASKNLRAGLDSSGVMDIEPYYNMIKLPGNIGSKEELILMRPFTPSGEKHNMVSWLAVRNSSDKYGEMILFNFPKNTNILGPDQVEVNINQIGEISENMTLWGQSGSRVFKGSLLVIPIEDSVLYVEPIYIQSSSPSSIPQVRKVVVGYQKNNDFKAGVGDTLENALNQLFKGITPTTPAKPTDTTKPDTTVKPANEKLVSDIISKYDALKKQIDELGNLINDLKK